VELSAPADDARPGLDREIVRPRAPRQDARMAIDAYDIPRMFNRNERPA